MENTTTDTRSEQQINAEDLDPRQFAAGAHVATMLVEGLSELDGVDTLDTTESFTASALRTLSTELRVLAVAAGTGEAAHEVAATLRALSRRVRMLADADESLRAARATSPTGAA